MISLIYSLFYNLVCSYIMEKSWSWTWPTSCQPRKQANYNFENKTVSLRFDIKQDGRTFNRPLSTIHHALFLYLGGYFYFTKIQDEDNLDHRARKYRSEDTRLEWYDAYHLWQWRQYCRCLCVLRALSPQVESIVAVNRVKTQRIGGKCRRHGPCPTLTSKPNPGQ